MSVFRGAGVALVTPFCEDKSVNYGMLETLIERQIAGHTDAIIVCGTTGEPATMTEEERLSVIAAAVKCTAGRVPVLAGCGGNCTENVAAFAQKAEALGVDALLAVTPFYNKATQNGLYEHYRYVAHRVGLPLIIYNVPSRTGCNLLPETAVRIAGDCENVVGIKEAGGNISQVADLARLAELAGLEFAIYSGNDDQILPILSLGGIGVISVLSNIVPEEVHEMVDAYLQGNLQRARELQLGCLELVHALFCEVNPIPAKAALAMLGYEAGGLRLPLTSLEECHQEQLHKALVNAGLLH
ncbi:MAG: 4-hydroxy-tetrahydrodipicolinate synthase [Blautia sp.]|nr:4-hydroxy-tetrahydrodipicolinate synthase [Blautia sp.]